MRDFVLETDFFFFSNFLFNLLEIILLYKICCFQWFKDTNLKANHNSVSTPAILFAVVSNGSKILI